MSEYIRKFGIENPVTEAVCRICGSTYGKHYGEVCPDKTEVKPKSAGIKYDKGKTRWDLLPWDALEKVADVYTYGATKYADRNWELGLAYSRILRALLSHLFKRFIYGCRENTEDGNVLHLAQVAWNALALLTYDLRGLDQQFDDLTPGRRSHETNPQEAIA